ncbi:MAG: DUF2802 domain-containing protein [Gammaproteobacteria bacterium]
MPLDLATIDLAFAALAAASLLGAWLAVAAARRANRRLREQDQRLEALQEDVRALCAGAVGVDERMARLEQRARRLTERQEQIELRDSGDRLYAQAVRMVEKGAGVDELVSVCGLSRGEAELMVRMRGLEQTA